eukprot:jgi/Botrbrau1/23238/Bobra.0041s0074.1
MLYIFFSSTSRSVLVHFPPDLARRYLRYRREEEDGEEEEEELLGPDGTFNLGALDITSTDVSLKGVEDEIERYADHDVLKAILDQGCDPKEFGQQYESQLRQAELESIQDYISESDNLVALHDQISACDAILGSMEEMLGKFQSDLGSISTEIPQPSGAEPVHERLQGAFGGPCTRSWTLRTRNEAARESAAYRDVAPRVGEASCYCPCTSARDYLMTRIYALRKPKDKHSDSATERAAEVQVLGRLPTAARPRGVPRGSSRLRRHPLPCACLSLPSLLGCARALAGGDNGPQPAVNRRSIADGGGQCGGQPLGAGGRGALPPSRNEAFALGERGCPASPIWTKPLAFLMWLRARASAFPSRSSFRSVNKLVMDTATSEYLFCCDFFQDDTVFNELFAPTLAVVESALTSQLQELYDLVGLLPHDPDKLPPPTDKWDKRRIPCLDAYLDASISPLAPLQGALSTWGSWGPQVLLDMQLGSVKAFNVAAFGEDTRVQPLTQRYATLTTSLLLLNAAYQDGQLDQNIDRMRYAVMDLLVRLSQRFAKRRQGTIFLINNFTHVCQMMRDAASKGSQMMHAPGTSPPPPSAPLGAAGAETIKDFEDQLATCTKLYVEEQLEQHFKDMIHYVKYAEAAVARAKGGTEGRAIPGYGPAEAAPIIKAFAARWTSAIEAMNKETLADFKVGGVGREVLKATLTQLLLYYTRLLELLKKQGNEGQALVRDAVTVPSIMYEIKRYSRT